MAQKKIASIRELKGKTIGVSQIGDAPYNYTVGLIGAGLTPRDVQWIPVGSGRQRPRRRPQQRPRGRHHVDRARVFQVRGTRL